jgi:hypothetical protein
MSTISAVSEACQRGLRRIADIGSSRSLERRLVRLEPLREEPEKGTPLFGTEPAVVLQDLPRDRHPRRLAAA